VDRRRDLGKTHVDGQSAGVSRCGLIHNGFPDVDDADRDRQSPQMPTPLLTETMKYITVNPTLGTCRSRSCRTNICRLWPRRPTVLERMGLHGVQPTGTASTRIFQPAPGDKQRGLAALRFNFPQPVSNVYQHDTPEKVPVSRKERRAYSHGCMRVGRTRSNMPKLSASRSSVPSEGLYGRPGFRHMFSANDELDIQFPGPDPGSI